MTKATAPTGVTPAKSSTEIEKEILRLKEIGDQLEAKQKELDARAKELDSREVKMNVPSAEVIREVVHKYKSKADKMKENLESQPKVTIMVPLEPGEVEGSIMPVTLNGYKTEIVKGVYSEVPKQVADEVMRALKQTVAAGQSFRTDVARPSKGGITVEQALS